MNASRIAFVGIGQSYPSHLWMRRMRQLLGDRVVVNIDDLRNASSAAGLSDDIHYLPRKMSRMMRALRAFRLTGHTSERLRNEWMLQTISRAGASLVFVHFLDFAAQFNEVWSRLNIPVVVHCHGIDIHWDVQDMVKKKNVHAEGYTDRVRSLPENVWFIANSTFTKRQLQLLNVNPEKIFLKRFGVPLSERPRSIYDDQRRSVLFLGRLIDFKGPLETVCAFGQISAKHPAASLEIAGDGPLAADLDELINQLGIHSQIHRHGAVKPSRGKDLRRRAAIFTAHNQTGAITRQNEAFGVSLLEAMGEGLAVVTGRSGGIPDFIQHGENGLLFEPGDIGGHAAMLDDLLSSKRQRESLGAAAWETVRDNYQAHHEREDMIRIFDSVCQLGSLPTLRESTRRQAA